MNILLTGGAGFIGSHTGVELLNAGHDVVVVDNLYNSSEKSLERVQELTGKTIKFYNADCCDFAAMDKIFAENEIDAVIHFAAYKAVGESVAKPMEYYRNNIDATLTVCEAMKKHGVKRFIFSSSATVYGIPDHMPLDETMPTSCTNPYGWTKYMNEQILRDISVANKDWSVVLLRYFNPIGAHESGRIGEMPNGIPNNLMPRLIKVATGQMEAMTVYGNDYPTKDGTGVRDYIHVVDLAQGHLAAINWVRNHTECDAFNLGTGTGYSVLDLIHSLEAVSGKKMAITYTPRRAGDIAACYADPTKAKTILGWEAKLGVEKMCEDAWNYAIKHQ